MADKNSVFIRAYRSFTDLQRRCTNPKSKDYHRYGGRGIQVRITRAEFVEWYIREAKNQTDLTVDRIDNDGHYEPNNLRLVTNSKNLSLAHQSSIAMQKAVRKNIKKAYGKISRKVRIGDRLFSSINEASRYFSPTGSSGYLYPRMVRCGGRMPDGTLIEFI